MHPELITSNDILFKKKSKRRIKNTLKQMWKIRKLKRLQNLEACVVFPQ